MTKNNNKLNFGPQLEPCPCLRPCLLLLPLSSSSSPRATRTSWIEKTGRARQFTHTHTTSDSGEPSLRLLFSSSFSFCSLLLIVFLTDFFPHQLSGTTVRPYRNKRKPDDDKTHTDTLSSVKSTSRFFVSIFFFFCKLKLKCFSTLGAIAVAAAAAKKGIQEKTKGTLKLS